MSSASPSADTVFNRARQDLACGISLLTRVPVGWLLTRKQKDATAPWPLARSIWCWPIVGAAIGALTGGFLSLMEALSIAPLPAAGVALAAQGMITGAFHEDGLADMADSYGAQTRERKLDIMRDSRIGSYGVLALCLSILIRAGAMAAFPAAFLIPILAVSACVSRAAMLWLPRLLPAARPDGVARALSPLPRMPFLGAQLVTIAITLGSLVCASFYREGPDRLHHALMVCCVVWVTAGLGTALVGFSARRQLGGYTGDVLGASVSVAECLVLATLTALFQN
ncbi:hypothetical protein HK13_05420 [Acetobacter indonesiensis]|uniref:adenosylcobinamide-GDP ribazoletransferase n=1 Tax=Acetobacter indonesiensis TaxID=104101 RepID=UPI000A396264|nr:adenosylcobinamide-GDP ribazoletransferase [Acetobacter indonesiensis]OUI94165.1 hypothetical protein HK13_05420 [Acetobacter indonesiensis]